MDYINTVKAFFNTAGIDPSAVIVRNAFSAASDAFDAACRVMERYTTRANHRYTIFQAAQTLYKAPLGDPYAADAYDEVVAGCTDPDDFAQYTEEYLDAHTDDNDNLTRAFDALTAAFVAFNPADNLYTSAADLYKALCETYKFSAAAYRNAAFCAMVTALKGNVEAVKDQFRVGLLENTAANAAPADAVIAKAKAAAFKAKAAERAAKAGALERKARAAETKAEVFIAKAITAEAKAESALESS